MIHSVKYLLALSPSQLVGPLGSDFTVRLGIGGGYAEGHHRDRRIAV
jgi:hypothetical protein